MKVGENENNTLIILYTVINQPLLVLLQINKGLPIVFSLWTYIKNVCMVLIFSLIFHHIQSFYYIHYFHVYSYNFHVDNMVEACIV